MKNLTWQNPEQLFVAQELINKVKSKCCGIKDNVNGKIYFGELTLFPNSGFGKFVPEEWDKKLGDFLDLDKIDKCKMT